LHGVLLQKFSTKKTEGIGENTELQRYPQRFIVTRRHIGQPSDFYIPTPPHLTSILHQKQTTRGTRAMSPRQAMYLFDKQEFSNRVF